MELIEESVSFSATEMPSRPVSTKAYRILRRPRGVVKAGYRHYLVNSANEPVWYLVRLYRNRRWGSKRFELRGQCSCPAYSACAHLLVAGWTEHRERTAR